MMPDNEGSEFAECSPDHDEPLRYTVGYGRPPKAHQFRKGQSGNLAGRPKRESVTLQTAIDDALAKLVNVRANGRERRITSLEAFLWSQMRAALQGKLSAVRYVVRLAKKTDRLKNSRNLQGVLTRADPELDRLVAEFHALKAAGDPRADV